jgi:hypothetical protein
MPKPLTNEAYRTELARLADWIVENVKLAVGPETGMEAMCYALGFGVACNKITRERAIEVLDFATKAGQQTRLIMQAHIGEMTEH